VFQKNYAFALFIVFAKLRPIFEILLWQFFAKVYQ